MDFETDDAGMLVTCPLMGWRMAPVADTLVLVRLRYAETPEELGTEGRALQMILTPSQAQELADELAQTARRILDQRPNGPAD